MSKNGTQREKESTRQIGCRANEREEVLITHAAKLDKRTRNQFIVAASLAAAQAVLHANGVAEESLFPKGAEGGIRRKRVAA